MSWMRPRAESGSSPRVPAVGQSLRHRPQEMHVARSSDRTCEGDVEMDVTAMSVGYGRMTATMPALAERLRALLPPDAVIDDPATLIPYAYDASFWSLR